MIKYALRRLLLLVFTLWLASVLVFLITNVMPGNIAKTILGAHASHHEVVLLSHQLGLDKPLLTRYLSWFGEFLRGNWGKSLMFGTPVFPLVMHRFGNSVILAVYSLALLFPSGVVAGIYAAMHEGGAFDRILSVVSLSFGSIPEFVTGVILLVVLSISLNIFPVQAQLGTNDPFVVMYNLFLPSVALMLTLFAYVFRMARTGMIDALDSDYAKTAVLKGLSKRRVVVRHLLRNALLPTITISAAQLGWMVGGLVVIETLFHYPGIGSLIYQAALNKDIPLLAASTILVTAVFAGANFVADMLYALLNPRIRESFASG